MEKYRAAGPLIVFRPCPAAGRLALFKQSGGSKQKQTTTLHRDWRLQFPQFRPVSFATFDLRPV